LPFFWTSAFSGVANWQQSEEVEQKTRVQNYKPSLSKGIKIVSVFQRLHGEIGRTIFVTNKHTDKQTNKKNSTFLTATAAGEIRAPPNLAGLTHSFAARGR